MRDTDYNDIIIWNRKGNSWYGDTVTWNDYDGG